MDNVTQLPVNEQVQSEAEAWIVKLDGAESLTDTDRAALREWLSRSPLHRQALEQANRFWGNNILAELAMPEQSKVSGWGRSAWAASLAAVAIVAICLAVFMPGVPAIDSANGLHVTVVGQRSTVQLPDGSTIDLNTNTQIEVEYSDFQRNVRLMQGEAHFTVAKDAEKPFRVYAADNRVQAIGTAFTVHLQANALDVLVTEGVVGLASLERAARKRPGVVAPLAGSQTSDIDTYAKGAVKPLGVLRASQSARLIDNGMTQESVTNAVQSISSSELTRRQAWREGYLVFAGEPLEQAVKELSRYTPVAIDIQDPALKAVRVGGRFQLGEVDALMGALEANFPVKVERVSYNKIRIHAIQ